MTQVLWRERFDDLRQRRPGLAQRVCRRLLFDMQRRGLIDLDDIDEEIAVALKLSGSPARLDPNRPKPRLPKQSRHALYELALKYAERHLSAEEIDTTIRLTEKRALALEVARSAEDADTPLGDLRDNGTLTDAEYQSEKTKLLA